MTKRSKARGAIPRITRNKRRTLQQSAPSKRRLFDAKRKERFLRYFCGGANLSWAARKVGVHYRTVLRHRATDPVFGAAYDLAEAQSVPRLRAWLAEAKEEEEQRLTDAALGEGDEDEEDEPGGDIAPARLTVEQAMQFLRDHEQAQARRDKAARAPGGGGRPVSVASNEEVRDALIRGLKAHGMRVREELARRNGGGDPPSHEVSADKGPESSSEGPAPPAPPPPCPPGDGEDPS
jgi:hypothetical protein